MAETNYEMADTSSKQGSRTLWIILGIAAVILICCCCVVIVGALVVGITNYTIEPYRYFSPLLSLI